MITTIREILEGIAILLAMIAVIAIPNPAETDEARSYHTSMLQWMKQFTPESQPFVSSGTAGNKRGSNS